MTKPIKRVAITGGAGQIAYNLLFRIASGEMLGLDQPIALHILEVPDAIKMLEGVKMELEDCAYPLLKEINIGTDPMELFNGIHYALLVGAKPRGPGMERADLLKDNGKIFVEQGRALNIVADRDVKVLVVGNPCNTNCLIAMHNAKDIPRRNFHAMTRLDQNRAQGFLARRAHVEVKEVSHMIIWGNHSSTQVPDFTNAKILGKAASEVINDLKWLEGDFISQVQKRGAEIIASRGKSSAASAANAIIDAVRSIAHLNGKGEVFSSGIETSHNPYGITTDLVYSFPCHLESDGEVKIVSGLHLNEFISARLKATEKELLEERDFVRALL